MVNIQTNIQVLLCLKKQEAMGFFSRIYFIKYFCSYFLLYASLKQCRFRLTQIKCNMLGLSLAQLKYQPLARNNTRFSNVEERYTGHAIHVVYDFPLLHASRFPRRRSTRHNNVRSGN